MDTIEDGTLDRIRGSRKRARANARSVAALTDNPGCTRRRVIDAASVQAFELAADLGYPAKRGQSPFAITSGNRFEKRLKDDRYKLLAEALRPFVDLPTEGLRFEKVDVRGLKFGVPWLEARARRTDELLATIARGDPAAPHIVDHPVLVFEIAGTPVYLEPDALALRTGNQLQLVEIKSYPVIDGQADPGKLSATGGQAAVYLLALRMALRRLGFDPDVLRWSVILVAPRNFGRAATAHEIPLRKKAMALERVLRAIPATGSLLDRLRPGFTLDVDPGPASSPDRRRKTLEGAVRTLPMLYVPECLAGCDMARFCRQQAIDDDDPARLGRTARDELAGVPTLADALRLATSGRKPSEKELADVADALQHAHHALRRARAMAPKACGVGGSKRSRP